MRLSTWNPVAGVMANVASFHFVAKEYARAEDEFRQAVELFERAGAQGHPDFATLLDAQRQIRQARQSLIRAQQEAQVRLAEIEKLTGDEP